MTALLYLVAVGLLAAGLVLLLRHEFAPTRPLGRHRAGRRP